MKMHSEQKSQKLQEDSIQLSTNPSAPLPNPLSQGDSPHTVIYDPRRVRPSHSYLSPKTCSVLTQLSVTQDPFWTQCARMLYRKSRCVKFVMILDF